MSHTEQSFSSLRNDEVPSFILSMKQRGNFSKALQKCFVPEFQKKKETMIKVFKNIFAIKIKIQATELIQTVCR